MKRAFDAVVSAFCLVALSPVFGLIALFLLVTHGRPVIFSQCRVGRHGRTFMIHKFRTMTDGGGPSVTAEGDVRIHGVGRWLRAHKLDELPQFVNVLRGDMSLVGPRPEVPAYVELWPAEARPLILGVRPGITDPAAIAFRNESAILARSADPETTYVDEVIPAKVAMYLDYVASRTMAGDLRILRDTVRAVVRPDENGTS